MGVLLKEILLVNIFVGTLASFFFSNVPMALSAVYKEIAFKDQTVDVWYLCFWVSTYQFFVSFLFVPLLGVPFISGEANPPSISHLPNQFWNGALCWVGSAPCCCLGGLNMTINNSTSGLCPTIGEGTCPTPLGPRCGCCRVTLCVILSTMHWDFTLLNMAVPFCYT